jgi:hypothetical protein
MKFVVTACFIIASASANALDGDPTVDPCSLVTVAEVEQTIGKLQAPPRSGKNDRLLTCSYKFVDDANALDVWVYPAALMERARKQLKDRIPVKGLGEDAFTRVNPDTDYKDLFVLKGNAVVEVSVPMKTPGADAKLAALARKAIGRLK